MNNIVDSLAKRIEIVLTPLLGELMAITTVKIQCAKLGISPEDLTIPDLPNLAKNVERAVIIFLGSDKAKEVSQNIIRINS